MPKLDCLICDRQVGRWPNEDDKGVKVPGLGTICTSCTKCRECDRRLPDEFLGLRGSFGRKKACRSCHRKARKARAENHIEVSLNAKLSVEAQSSSHQKLIEFVRLEKVTAKGETLAFEVGRFGGRRLWDSTTAIRWGVSTVNKTRKGNEKLVPVVQREADKCDKRNDSIVYDRLASRVVSLLRRLGWRVTARRRRAKKESPNHWERMTWAEEYQARKTEIIEEGLPQKFKAKLEKLDERQREERGKLSEFARAFDFRNEVELPPSATELLAGE